MAFLVFEGLDGAGKSTLISGVENHLKALGQKVHLTREPGGTPLGEEIRQQLLRVEGDTPVPRAEMLLYEAARAQHVDRVIRPGLAEGKWILCDRFAPSTVAFQVGGRGLDRTAIDYLNSYATDGLLPDLVVLVDLPVEESLARMAKRKRKPVRRRTVLSVRSVVFTRACGPVICSRPKKMSSVGWSWTA